MTSLTAFHMFPRLPSELRIDIWNLALSSTRTVTLTCKRERRLRTYFAKSFVSATPVPALLHTCRESRLEGLLTYVPVFKTKHSPNYTYISFENDTIRCSDSILEYIGKEEIGLLQNMVLEVKDVAYFAHFHMDVLLQMSRLKKLDLLVSDEVIGWNYGRRYVDNLIGDFDMARKKNREWYCPYVTLLDRNTCSEVAVIPGGPAPTDEEE